MAQLQCDGRGAPPSTCGDRHAGVIQRRVQDRTRGEWSSRCGDRHAGVIQRRIHDRTARRALRVATATLVRSEGVHDRTARRAFTGHGGRRAPTSPRGTAIAPPSFMIDWHRRTVRRPSHDYAGPGAWLITLKCFHGLHSFGEVVDGWMVPNRVGEVVAAVWTSVPEHHPNVQADSFVVMPNHMHAVLVLTHASAKLHTTGDRFERFGKPVAGSVATIIRSFKAASTRQLRDLLEQPVVIWQRGFHDRALTRAQSLEQARRYIRENPMRWRDELRPRASRAYQVIDLGDGQQLLSCCDSD